MNIFCWRMVMWKQKLMLGVRLDHKVIYLALYGSAVAVNSALSGREILYMQKLVATKAINLANRDG